MAAPTFVSYTASSTFGTDGTNSRVISSVVVQAGDRIVLTGVAEDVTGISFSTPTDTASNTYSSATTSAVTNNCRTQIWTATAVSTTTLTITMGHNNPSGYCGVGATVWRSSTGFGTGTSTNATGAPSHSYVTSAANSALVVVVGDWNAIDGTTRTWRTVNSVVGAESTYFRNASQYTAYIGRHLDAGTAASKTVGLSAPTGQKYAISAIEVLGSSSGSAVDVAGTITGTATLTGVAAVTRPGAGTATGTATLAGVAAVNRAAAGTITGTATLTGAAAVNRAAAGTVTGTATLTGVAAVSRVIAGTLTVTGTIAGAGANARLFKTLHQSIGHAPSSIADIEVAFSPNTASGGWHRGDGGMPIPGTNWTLYCCNDFFVSDGVGGVQAFFRRNSVLMVDHDDGQVWWLSGGDGFPIAGSVTFAGPTSGSGWGWLNGGWQTGSDSCILLGAWWVTASPYTLTEYRVMSVTGLTTSSPIYSVTQATNLNVGTVHWNGIPFIDSGRVLVYGIGSDLGMYLASCAISTNAADYGTWSYWDGSGWTTTFANRAVITVQAQPLRALNVIPWQGKWLAAAKDFDSAPELGVPDAWTELKVWVSDNPTGPWKYHGIVADTSMTDWWSYAGRVEVLPGMTIPTAAWSVNTLAEDFDPDIYGLQFAAPDQVGVATATAAIAGTAGFLSGGAGDRTATATITGAATVSRVAAGTQTTTAGITGTAAVVTPVAGSITATANATGTALVVHTVAGTLTGTATITGAIGITLGVAGTTAGVATITGAATLDRSITGTFAATATITGSAGGAAPGGGGLTATASINGAAAVNQAAAGTLAATATIAGAAAVTLLASGSLTVTATRTGAGTVAHDVAGNITVTATITGEPTGVGDIVISGNLTATASMTGAVLANHGIAGTLNAASTITGALQASLQASGNRTVTATITGAAGGVFIAGTLTTTAGITGTVAVGKDVHGDLTVTSTRTGAAASGLVISGDLSVTANHVGAMRAELFATGHLVGVAIITGEIPATQLPSVIIDVTLEDVTFAGSITMNHSINIAGPVTTTVLGGQPPVTVSYDRMTSSGTAVTSTQVPITVSYTRVRGTVTS